MIEQHGHHLPLGVDIERWLKGGQTPWDAFPDTRSGKMDAESCPLAKALAAAMTRAGRQVPCFVQVNIGEEEQKGGCAIADLPQFLAEVRALGLPVIGLMAVPPADVEFEGRQEADRLRRAMETLPPEQLELLKMSFYREASHSMIAAELGLPMGTVKSRIRLAFAKLRAALEERA